MFGIEPAHTINDILTDDSSVSVDDILHNFSDKLDLPLSVAFASTDFRKIGEIIRADRKQRQQSLKRILRLKDDLSENYNFDYVVIDTSPGVSMESIDGLVISDGVCLVLKVDDFDIAGTKSMVAQLYTLLDAKTFVVVNRIVPETCDIDNPPPADQKIIDKVSKALHMDIVGALSCYCEVARVGSRELFTVTRPDHGFSREVNDLVGNLIENL